MEFKNELTLIFRRQEIIDDVNRYAFVEGDLMPESTGHEQHITFDIMEDGNRELCARIINLTLAECHELLLPFTKFNVLNPMDVTNILREPDNLLILMYVPDNFSATTGVALKEYIHQLMVFRILANWLDITKPEAAIKYKIKGDELIDKIKSAKSKRTTRTRRRISCFP